MGLRNIDCLAGGLGHGGGYIVHSRLAYHYLQGEEAIGWLAPDQTIGWLSK